jgi:uncharacterized protein GlcG (DUF336 family)
MKTQINATTARARVDACVEFANRTTGESTGRAYHFAPGGFPIVVENQLIGAIGVGGGPQEEQCAYQALTKVLGAAI